MDLVGAKRRNPATNERGDSQSPCVVAAPTISTQVRVLAVKLDLDWRNAEDKAMRQRLRDLSWQAARYRNCMLRRKWAETIGLRVDPTAGDKTDVSKQGRKTEKGELSGSAYSCAEQEVAAIWGKHAKTILAGGPLPEWRTDAALSVTGKARMADSGVRIERDKDRFYLMLQAQAATCEGGSWLRLPIAKGTRHDEYVGPMLDRFASWETAIKKATVHVGRQDIMVKLTYQLPVTLPPMGERVATIGPIDKWGRLLCRTELQTKDYTRELTLISERKQAWDLIRRRVTAQIGRRKSHARTKRELLSRLTWEDWLETHLHTWTRRCAEWCESQGVGEIRMVAIDTGDWPAFKFKEFLRYKAADKNMVVVDRGVSLDSASVERAVEAPIKKTARQAKRRREAVTELTHQLGGHIG